MSFIYSIEMPPAFMDLLEGQVLLSSLELAVGAAVSSEATKEM